MEGGESAVTPLYGLLAVVTLLVLLQRVVKRHAMKRYPPGPHGWPIIGNLAFPTESSWRVYRAWSDTYGGWWKNSRGTFE